jgi:hypothetical protein
MSRKPKITDYWRGVADGMCVTLPRTVLPEIWIYMLRHVTRNHPDGWGMAWRSIPEIARDLDMHSLLVRQQVQALIDAGLIRKNGRKSIEIRPPHIEIPDNLKGILE